MAYQIEQAIPGLPRLSQRASALIEQMLSGNPSPNEARLANAYYGVGAGVDPTSEWLSRRGFDLYSRQSDARKQQGFKDLLSLVGTYSGTVAPTPGQELQDRQQTNQLNQQQNQFNSNLGFEREQYNKQLELVNQYLGPGGGQGPGYGSGNVGAAASFDNRGVPLDIYGNPLNQADYNRSMGIAAGGFPAPARQYAFGPNIGTGRQTRFTMS